MLKYKDAAVELEFWDKRVFHVTRYGALYLAEYTEVRYGKDLIVTDVLRPATADPSAHPAGRAFDGRARDSYWTPAEELDITTEMNRHFKRTDGLTVARFHGPGTADAQKFFSGWRTLAQFKISEQFLVATPGRKKEAEDYYAGYHLHCQFQETMCVMVAV